MKWYFLQLFPLTYRSEYRDEFGNRMFTVWKMWFGWSYNIDTYYVREKKEPLPKGEHWVRRVLKVNTKTEEV